VQLADPEEACFLKVSVPFLAGIYDERMFEELRLRVQRLKVLTSGVVSADNLGAQDDEDAVEDPEDGVRLPALPARRGEESRVRLHVWEDPRIDHESDCGGDGLRTGFPA
jgi:hypothetical protein